MSYRDEQNFSHMQRYANLLRLEPARRIDSVRREEHLEYLQDTARWSSIEREQRRRKYGR